MVELRGNAVVAQSGGPTAVINSSMGGVIQEALGQGAIERVYAARNGILGVLNEELMDMSQEDPATIELLKATPAAASGSCRFKLKSLKDSRADYERVLEVFRAHHIRYFFYNGGNDSMDTCSKVNQLAVEIGWEIRCMGIPKTIDNDLAFTDHCPGYGSVIKFNATSIMEAARDTDAMYTFDTVTIHEVMGRNAGWIAAGAVLAKRDEADGPHLVYLPEAAFDENRFLDDVNAVYQKYKRCFIAVGEGLRDDKGNYVSAETSAIAKDSFGHAQLGGAADFLKMLIQEKLKLKARTNRAGTAQRAAMHFASLTDRDEAYLCGQTAVRHAIQGVTGKMVTLVREGNSPYRCATGLANLDDVANGEKKVPREWINTAGNLPTQPFLDYARPLIQGEVPIQIRDGLPVYARLKGILAEKKCGPWKKA
jgi:6-phosphofructokinase 1